MSCTITELENVAVELRDPNAVHASAILHLLTDAGLEPLTPITHTELSILSVGFATRDEMDEAVEIMMGDPRVVACCGGAR